MMTYIDTRRNRGVLGNKKLTLSVILFVSIILLIQILFPHFFSILFTGAFRPFWRENFSVTSGSLDSDESLLLQNEILRQELLAQKTDTDTVGAILKENYELKHILGRDIDVSTTTITNITNNFVLAPILVRPPQAPYDLFIIDGGADYGFQVDDKVFAYSKVPLGRIIEVGAETSKVILYSSPNEKYNVQIGDANLPAIAMGRGGGQFSADLPRLSDVKQGDFVSSPNLDPHPFAIVRGIISDPSQPFVTVLFGSPVNIFGLRWVLVSRTRDQKQEQIQNARKK